MSLDVIRVAAHFELAASALGRSGSDLPRGGPSAPHMAAATLLRLVTAAVLYGLWGSQSGPTDGCPLYR